MTIWCTHNVLQSLQAAAISNPWEIRTRQTANKHQFTHPIKHFPVQWIHKLHFTKCPRAMCKHQITLSQTRPDLHQLCTPRPGLIYTNSVPPDQAWSTPTLYPQTRPDLHQLCTPRPGLIYTNSVPPDQAWSTPTLYPQTRPDLHQLCTPRPDLHQLCTPRPDLQTSTLY